jgi:hypothetical protein
MDGLLDILIPSADWGSIMYHNLGTETPRNWIGFDLWGTQSSRDPLGTLVSLYAGGKKQIRYTKAATTWKIQDNPFVHFGIDNATSIDSVVIRWPIGNVEVFTELAINQYHKIVELAGTAVKNVINSDIPKTFALNQNYPNPFNPETRISYEIPKSSKVVIEIFNVSGQKIVSLVNDFKKAGRHMVSWSGKNDLNHKLPSGIYIYQLKTNNASFTKKMLFVQ